MERFALPDKPDPDPLTGVRAAYDRWAHVYDHDRNPLPALEEPRVRAAVGDVHGLTVLDLGCGTGRHAAWLSQTARQVVGLDFSEGMLAGARRNVTSANTRFLAHDFHRPFPFPRAAFDVI